MKCIPNAKDEEEEKMKSYSLLAICLPVNEFMWNNEFSSFKETTTTKINENIANGMWW